MSEDKDKLEFLKKEADKLHIKYHHKIGTDKLETLISDAKNTSNKKVMSVEEERAAVIKDLTKEVRVIVSCNDPAMREIEGEWLTVGNSFIPSRTKYLPFDNSEGWHLPKMMVDQLKEAKCNKMLESKGEGNITTSIQIVINKYTVSELPPLTRAQLDALAEDQIARQAIDK